jgi:hypothetical protein
MYVSQISMIVNSIWFLYLRLLVHGDCVVFLRAAHNKSALKLINQ